MDHKASTASRLLRAPDQEFGLARLAEMEAARKGDELTPREITSAASAGDALGRLLPFAGRAGPALARRGDAQGRWRTAGVAGPAVL